MTHPDLAAEWHPTKNTLTPTEVRPGSNRKVSWLCSKDPIGRRLYVDVRAAADAQNVQVINDLKKHRLAEDIPR